MSKLKVFAAKLVILAMLLSVAGFAGAATVSEVSPEQALEMLMKGNRNFVKGDLENIEKMSSPKVRAEVAKGQHPYAIIVDCSDSRLSPEIIFDKGLGEIFVIRVAGNIVAPHQLGSIEYAIEHLGARLVMVLGHTKCGAVTATVETAKAGNCEEAEGNIGSLVTSICPAVRATQHHMDINNAAFIENAIDENISLVKENIMEGSAIVEEGVSAGEVKVVKAKYDLETGKVTIMAE